MEVINGDGERKTLNITIKFDPTIQGIALEFKTDELKSWEFILGVLEMAKARATMMQTMAGMAQMQDQAMAQQLKAQVLRGR